MQDQLVRQLETTKHFERLRGMGKIQKEERWVCCEIAAKR